MTYRPTLCSAGGWLGGGGSVGETLPPTSNPCLFSPGRPGAVLLFPLPWELEVYHTVPIILGRFLARK